MGVPSGLISISSYWDYKVSHTSSEYSGPGRSRLCPPFLFQLCPIPHWTRQQPGSAQATLSDLSSTWQRTCLAGWLGSDVPGSQESHFVKGCPLPMPGLGDSANNLSLKMSRGYKLSPILSLQQQQDSLSSPSSHTHPCPSFQPGGYWPDSPTSGPQDR